MTSRSGTGTWMELAHGGLQSDDAEEVHVHVQRAMH